MIEWPLMKNNIERTDLDLIINYLEQEDPKLTHGPIVKDFENKWSEWLGVKYSVMVNSGASANDLTMKAIAEINGVGEIIVPPLTWVSDIASVIQSGLKPVFVDINFKNLSFNLQLLSKSITKKTKAVFVTHVLGLNALTDELINICKENNILLIEDACESHGATFGAKKVGSIGYASNFSFYYAHHMTTIEGGMISTDDSDFYQMLLMLRSHGLVRESSSKKIKGDFEKKYPDLNPDFIFAYSSHNMRPNEINGILGLSQLKRLDENNKARSINFSIFLENLDPEKFYVDFLADGSSSYAFPVIMKEASIVKRNRAENALKTAGIEFRRGLSGGGNQIRQPYLKKNFLQLNPLNFPIVDHIHFFAWYVGNYPSLERDKIMQLCQLLNASV